MIRPFHISDTDDVVSLWLDCVIKAHPFISEVYWTSHAGQMKEIYLPQSETFVYETDKVIKGFISIVGNSYVGGLFVGSAFQGCGIGKSLLSYAKSKTKKLSLNVYKKNQKAVRFYKSNGFVVEKEQIDSQTGQPEFVLSFF